MNIFGSILGLFVNLTEKYGVKKVLFGTLTISIIICIVIPKLLMWEDKDSVKITPIIDGMDVVKQDLNIDVTRKTEATEGWSLLESAGDGILSISKNGDYISMAKDLEDKCDKISEKHEKIIIPKGAGYINAGDMSIYSWDKKGKRKLTDQDFFEKKIIFELNNNEYIEASIESESMIFGFNTAIEVGNIN